MTRSDRGRAIVADLPTDRILTETDGPFTHIDGHPAEPINVHMINELIARIRNVSANEIASTIKANLETLHF